MGKITVADILKLDIMKSHRLVAGEKGLSNPIHYVNIYDNPISKEDMSIPLFSDDIYLTFFYYGKDNPDYIMYALKWFINSHATALIVFDEYMDKLPNEALNLCNENGFPVIFLDCKTPYSLVISSIMEYKINSEQKKRIEDKIDAIVSRKVSPEEKNELISDLNPHFKKNAVVLFVNEENNISNNSPKLNLINVINRDILSFAALYRNGVILILSFADNRLTTLEKDLKSILDLIKNYIPNGQIGISNPVSLPDLGSAISQSYIAISAGQTNFDGPTYYKNLGVSRILVDILGTPVLESFYHDIINPIEKVDLEHNACLLETMLTFCSCNMDYKKTSKTLFVHENTIRYRISRIKDIIPYGKSEIDFYETMSVISKIYKMKQLSS